MGTAIDVRPRPTRTATNEIDVVLSDHVDDVDDALMVVHHGFVAAGYTEPRPSGRRMHPSYLNPGTRFALARIEDEPVGTVAMVSDGPFGLPCERAFAEEVDTLRMRGSVHEVGSLVVDAQWRRHTRRIFLHIMATMVRLVLDFDDDDSVVMAMAPETARFTGGMFGATPLADPRPLFGAPAVLLRTSRPQLLDCFAEAATSGRRELRRMVLDPDPEWLDVRLCGDPFPREWWEPLLEEEGTAARLRNQLAILRKAPCG
jgi:hypothetical protein